MKKAGLFLLFVLLISCGRGHKSPTILQIKTEPETFADGHYFYLQKVKVVETHSILNYSISKIEDTTGNILLISSVPYNKGRKLKKIKVRYIQLFSKDDQKLELLVDKKAAETVEKYAPILFQFGLDTFSGFLKQ